MNIIVLLHKIQYDIYVLNGERRDRGNWVESVIIYYDCELLPPNK